MDLTAISNFINSLSQQGAAWYRGISGSPVVVPGTPAQVQQQGILLQQQAVGNLAYQQPTLAGILASPTFLILGIVAIVVILIIVLRR